MTPCAIMKDDLVLNLFELEAFMLDLGPRKPPKTPALLAMTFSSVNEDVTLAVRWEQDEPEGYH